MRSPAPPFEHLERLTDTRGVFEHADGIVPRVEHGYCTDDNARLLVVACREAGWSPRGDRLAAVALDFVRAAQLPDGSCHNRLDPRGVWVDDASVGDCWGRSLWGLGTAVARSFQPSIRQRALEGFAIGAAQRSPWRRSMAFAMLGASEVLAADPRNAAARALMGDGLVLIADGALTDEQWPWPEPRLTYANAVLPEAMLAAGLVLREQQVVADGLRLLGWLIDQQMIHGRLSLSPVGGSGIGDPPNRFDQQPLEAAALADACLRAIDVSSDERWARGAAASIGWFFGNNDAHAMMVDQVSGGGYDGLHEHGPNLNQGAESTLALVAAMQCARAFVARRNAARSRTRPDRQWTRQIARVAKARLGKG